MSAEIPVPFAADEATDLAELAEEHRYLVTYARILCAVALCDDDLHVRSIPLWKLVIDTLERPRNGGESDDHLAEERALTAADLMSSRVPIPSRVAMLACASGGDYQFDEASGLMAAMILGGPAI